MTKRRLASSVALFTVLLARVAVAQSSQNVTAAGGPEWLKDRRYNEGIGIRTGDVEIHPGIAGEVGYDSNYFMRSDDTRPFIGNAASGGAPIVPPRPFESRPRSTCRRLARSDVRGPQHYPP